MPTVLTYMCTHFSGQYCTADGSDWPVARSPSSGLCWSPHSTGIVVKFSMHSKAWLHILVYLCRYVTASTTIVSGVSYVVQMEGFRVLIKKKSKRTKSA